MGANTLADQSPCASARLSFTGGMGTLSEGNLSVSFSGTINGLNGTACGVVTDSSGTYGPAINEDQL